MYVLPSPSFRAAVVRAAVRRAVRLAVGVGLCVVMAACDVSTTRIDADPAPPAPKTAADFGDPYRIVTERVVLAATGAADTLDLAPTLTDPQHTSLADHPGRLTVTVQYTGGCRDHDFAVEASVGPRRTRLWLIHDAYRDPCEALPSETLTLDVPDAAFAAPRVVLLAPDGATLLLRG